MIELLHPVTPDHINQDMIWIADYNDNSYLSEFNLQKNEENNFYDIDKQKLKKFGLIGMDYNCYFDIFGGIFHINNRKINIRLLTNEHVHFLTEQNLLYNDIITYKQATAKFNLKATAKQEDLKIENQSEFTYPTEASIDSFHIGYKTQFNSNGVNFYFQVIACFPYIETPYFNIKIVSDQNLQGNLVVMVDGSTSLNLEASIIANYGGEINWKIAL